MKILLGVTIIAMLLAAVLEPVLIYIIVPIAAISAMALSETYYSMARYRRRRQVDKYFKE